MRTHEIQRSLLVNNRLKASTSAGKRSTMDEEEDEDTFVTIGTPLEPYEEGI